MVVHLYCTATAPQEVRQVCGQCLFLAGWMGDGGKLHKSVCDFVDDLAGVHLGDSSFLWSVLLLYRIFG